MIDNRKPIIMAITELGGVGPRMFQQLLLQLGAPENFPNATRQELADIPRIGENGSEKILKSLEQVDKFRERLEDYEKDGVEVITILDDGYPDLLRQMDDPPPVIYIKGDHRFFEHEYIAIVGTTQATQAGIRLTVDLSTALGKKGFGIVSGLASGIDSAAHLGAIKSGAPTIAVLGCGVLNVYPEENTALADTIAKIGLLVSEHQPYKQVKAARLILRNRLISAFAKAVIVTQVGVERRGELRTAEYAFKQAKPVFFADPEGDLDKETIQATEGVLIDGIESVDRIIEYIV
jgi:DNA processing protein